MVKSLLFLFFWKESLLYPWLSAVIDWLIIALNFVPRNWRSSVPILLWHLISVLLKLAQSAVSSIWSLLNLMQLLLLTIILAINFKFCIIFEILNSPRLRLLFGPTTGFSTTGFSAWLFPPYWQGSILSLYCNSLGCLENEKPASVFWHPFPG